MLKIHVLDVKFGDSMLLETELHGVHHYSIIDCKSVGDKTPTVEFLQERNIRNIHSIFLTHLHGDHSSGFPSLLNYLQGVEGTLEYFVAPQLPMELTIWRSILSKVHDESTKEQLTAILGALNGFLSLPSRFRPGKKPLAVRMVYEGDSSPTAWRSHLHPDLLLVPVSPTPEEAFRPLQSVLNQASLSGKVMNAMSHAFLFCHNTGAQEHYGLLTGDLEGKTWRFVKNRCLEITRNAIRSRLTFLKVPHHGAFNPVMETCVKELAQDSPRIQASISCPPGDRNHPHEATLTFLKNKFSTCCITCTNISSHCHALGFPSIVRSLLDQSPKESEFLEFAMTRGMNLEWPSQPGACAGSHTVEMSENGCTVMRSTQIPCRFNPEGCPEW